MSGKIKRHRFHGFHRFVVASASDILVGITGFWNSAVAAKTFIKTGSKFDDSPDWTKGQLVFNTITWDKPYRLWGSSRNLTTIMKRPPKESEEIEWYKIELCGCDEPIKIWQTEPNKKEIKKNIFEDYLESVENLKFI